MIASVYIYLWPPRQVQALFSSMCVVLLLHSFRVLNPDPLNASWFRVFNKLATFDSFLVLSIFTGNSVDCHI